MIVQQQADSESDGDISSLDDSHVDNPDEPGDPLRQDLEMYLLLHTIHAPINVNLQGEGRESPGFLHRRPAPPQNSDRASQPHPKGSGCLTN